VVNQIEEVWLKQYGYLLGFRQLFPDTWPKVTTEYPDGNSLGMWCEEQRIRHAQDRLDPITSQKLSDIGFSWLNNDEKWVLQYDLLKEFLQENSRFPSYEEEYPAGNFLGRWCNFQRQNKSKGKLKDGEETILNKIGFSWEISS